jgi:hypothetical protein
MRRLALPISFFEIAFLKSALVCMGTAWRLADAHVAAIPLFRAPAVVFLTKVIVNPIFVTAIQMYGASNAGGH